MSSLCAGRRGGGWVLLTVLYRVRTGGATKKNGGKMKITAKKVARFRKKQ